MANNQSSDKDKASSPKTTIDELTQLRTIVFGEAQKELLKKISTLEHNLAQQMKNQETSFSQRLIQLQQTITEKFDEMNERIEFTDKTHEDHEMDLQKNIESLASEHEMLATTTSQDIKNIEQALNAESTHLAKDFSQQIEQLKIHLEEVSQELSSSKTDRKTLAKLLATMATNLEDDQL